MQATREDALVGMFDWYRPAETHYCPLDDHPLEKWQGKDGPCRLLIWQEGVKHPVDHWVDEEVRFSASDLEAITLPQTFTIYSSDCPMHHLIVANCTAIDSTWCSTEIDQQDFDRKFVGSRAYRSADRESKTRRMQEFILVDLATQMPYLPDTARTWPRERLLAWLRVWGEVLKLEWPQSPPDGGDSSSYMFRSWSGPSTPFALTQDGHMFIRGTWIRAWPDDTP